MAQPQQPQEDPLALFKEQLRKLVEGAKPIQCPTGVVFTVYGSFFTAHYQCDELADFIASGLHPSTRVSMHIAWRLSLGILRRRHGEGAFTLIPPGLLYALNEKGDEASFTLGFGRPFSSGFTQFFTAFPLVFALHGIERDWFYTINMRNIYTFYVTLNINDNEDVYYFTFGLTDDLRDESKAPLASLFRKDKITSYTGLTETRFMSTDFGLNPIHIEQEITVISHFIAEAISHGRFSSWVHKDTCTGRTRIQVYTPLQVK